MRKSAVIVLKEFFGFKPGQTLKEFAEEVKGLSDAEKQELAQAAAKELGIEVADVVAPVKPAA
jgi:hypothetical protein